MEIRDPIHSTIELTPAESRVIDSRVFQRLRWIKQLGFSEFSFPGATHNRYIHSIGVCHLAGLAFDSIFRNYKFSSSDVRTRLRNVVRGAALLHDIGHGPLSHTTEEVMPKLKALNVGVYKCRRTDIPMSEDLDNPERRATHEDYTIKFITDSSLTEVLKEAYIDIDPLHFACLVDKTLKASDDFFVDQGWDFRPILSQIVSSELDVDRMDYLLRDAYFCGTTYGKVDLPWLLTNLTYHPVQGELYLALNRRALYTFDDFLVSRHHMNLMVYFHHKSVIYEEMLFRYLSDADCGFFLPSNIEQYINYNDNGLHEHLAKMQNPWARRVSQRIPYRVIYELHSVKPSPQPEALDTLLEENGIHAILTNSTHRLSKYHSASPEEKSFVIYVVDSFNKMEPAYPIQESTEVFQKYEEIRKIDRIYVAPEEFERAEKIIFQSSGRKMNSILSGNAPTSK